MSDTKHLNVLIAKALLLNQDITDSEQVDALTAHINGDIEKEEFKQYDHFINITLLALSLVPNISSELSEEQIVNAIMSFIDNPDMRSVRHRVNHFNSLTNPKTTSNEVEKKEVPQEEVIFHANKDNQNGQRKEEEDIPKEENDQPAYFEPGRYPDIPNEVYHSSNGISSSMLKDARISLMYYELRHVTKVIERENKRCFDLGSAFHTLTMEPEKFDAEFSVKPIIPEGAFTTTETMKSWIDEYNNKLPKKLSQDELKAIIEEHNATLTPQLSTSVKAEELGQIYMQLPDEFKTIPEDGKFTGAAMKACIKAYNDTLPTPLKTSGNTDALLEQIYHHINPELYLAEVSKPEPLRNPVKKDDLMQVIKEVNPDAVFEDEIISQWLSDDSKIHVQTVDYEMANNMRNAVMNHKEASSLLNHPNRVSEVSYYGIDEDTGLEIRVRPDIEIQTENNRLGFDLKSVALGRFKQDAIETMIRREIINRDYHISAAMYCDVAMLDQFFWIFVNKDEHYHWVAIVEASPELLELGRAEYKKTLRDIREAMDTGYWPAPITTTLTIGITDFEQRKLEELQNEVA